MSAVAPCDVCGYPTFKTAAVNDPRICSVCKMVALDLTYADGSSPATRLPEAKIEQIKESYFALTLQD